MKKESLLRVSKEQDEEDYNEDFDIDEPKLPKEKFRVPV